MRSVSMITLSVWFPSRCRLLLHLLQLGFDRLDILRYTKNNDATSIDQFAYLTDITYDGNLYTLTGLNYFTYKSALKGTILHQYASF